MTKQFLIVILMLSIGNTMYGSQNATATFAGGCFWCMEHPFKKMPGVVKVVSGYTDGKGHNPGYKDYAQKGYVEAIQIIYNPDQISYQELLNTFWRQIDPTDPDGQFVDRGHQYRSAIFYHNGEQKKLAEVSKKAIEQSGRFSKPIVTQILPSSQFYKAEEHHQNYAEKNPWKYWWYRSRSGRDQFLEKHWGEKKKQQSKKSLREKLTPLQYKVTQLNGTEPPFKNEYWDNTHPGIYVDIVSGEPLFSSLDKFKSGTGWPSFTNTIEPENIVIKESWSIFGKKRDVRSKKANSHLGDLFFDGPAPTGKRYCINSAALRFIPAQDLEKEGYGQYKKLFNK